MRTTIFIVASLMVAYSEAVLLLANPQPLIIDKLAQWFSHSLGEAIAAAETSVVADGNSDSTSATDCDGVMQPTVGNIGTNNAAISVTDASKVINGHSPIITKLL